MARTLDLHAPKSMVLHDMKPEEVARYVADHASATLDRLGQSEITATGVNAVSLSQLRPGGPAADIGVWAQWTRACRDQRQRIPDYVDPAVDDFGRPEAISHQLQGHAVDSQMKIQHVAMKKG